MNECEHVIVVDVRLNAPQRKKKKKKEEKKVCVCVCVNYVNY